MTGKITDLIGRFEWHTMRHVDRETPPQRVADNLAKMASVETTEGVDVDHQAIRVAAGGDASLS